MEQHCVALADINRKMYVRGATLAGEKPMELKWPFLQKKPGQLLTTLHFGALWVDGKDTRMAQEVERKDKQDTELLIAPDEQVVTFHRHQCVNV